jgi:nicotinamidase-related amidase
LFVNGGVEDMRRATEWMYRNLDRLTGLYFSLDTHSIYQIFHAAWWVDQRGQHPAPMTAITADDVRCGRWQPKFCADESLEYCQKLETQGKYVLIIWPYHVLDGGIGHALVPAVMEAAIFHGLVRGQAPHFERKGIHPQTENYSVFSPDVKTLARRRVGIFNRNLFDMLMNYDRIYVFGEASSHCVMETLRDLQAKISKINPSWMSKIWILRDAMSPVPPPPLDPLPAHLNFSAIAEQALCDFAQAGMKVVTTADPIDTEN